MTTLVFKNGVVVKVKATAMRGSTDGEVLVYDDTDIIGRFRKDDLVAIFKEETKAKVLR